MTHFQDTLLWTIDQRGRQMTDKIYLKSSVSISKENFQNAEAIKKKKYPKESFFSLYSKDKGHPVWEKEHMYAAY